MSDHQLGVYESARIAERAEAKRNKKRAKQKGDDIYQATTSTYKFSLDFTVISFSPKQCIDHFQGRRGN